MLRVYVWFTGFLALISSNSAVKMIADLSEKGVKGSVQISQPTPDNDITIEIFTESNIRPRMLTWKILETPKDLSKAQKCIDINPEEYIDLERFFGKIPVPGEKSFSMRKGSKLDMFQNDTIFGKALVIGEGFICSNFRMENGAQVELAKAEFKQPKVSGLVFFRMVTIGFRTHTLMYTDLFDSWNDPPTTSDHAWQLYYADPNANDQDRISGCEFLKAPAADDFSSTVGKIRVAGNSEPDSRKQFTLGDFSLPIGSRSLYLVLRDDKNPTDILACAEILPDYPRQSITVFGSSGVKGTITFEQRDPFSLTKISSDIEGLKKRAGDYHVHEYPLRTIDTCKGAGGHFNPTSVKTEQLPPPGVGTNDQYEFGDISGKHGTLRGLDFLRGELWDHSMPLWGKHSIQGRSLMIHDAFTGAGWVCANIIISSKCEFVRGTAAKASSGAVKKRGGEL